MLDRALRPPQCAGRSQTRRRFEPAGVFRDEHPPWRNGDPGRLRCGTEGRPTGKKGVLLRYWHIVAERRRLRLGFGGQLQVLEQKGGR